MDIKTISNWTGHPDYQSETVICVEVNAFLGFLKRGKNGYPDCTRKVYIFWEGH